MENETYRKCHECGIMTANSDYCKNCGAIINTNLRRQLEQKKRKDETTAKEKLQKPNSITVFFENARTHKNPVVRLLATIFYSIWMVVFMIGAFFAYLIGYIAA